MSGQAVGVLSLIAGVLTGGYVWLLVSTAIKISREIDAALAEIMVGQEIDRLFEPETA